MSKKTIRITETQLRRMIQECVREEMSKNNINEGWLKNTAIAGAIGAASIFGGNKAQAQNVNNYDAHTQEEMKIQKRAEEVNQMRFTIKQLKNMFPQAYKDRNANPEVWMKNKNSYCGQLPNGQTSIAPMIEASYGKNPWLLLLKKFNPDEYAKCSNKTQKNEIYNLIDFDIQ